MPNDVEDFLYDAIRRTRGHSMLSTSHACRHVAARLSLTAEGRSIFHVVYNEAMDWKLRARVFIQRLTQPTCACMICMTAPTFANLVSLAHWKIALQTGVGTGILALLLSITPVGRLFANRYGNALLMGLLTAV